jgi:hypothetical protein
MRRAGVVPDIAVGIAIDGLSMAESFVSAKD